MRKEIRQPQIPQPDLGDASTWGRLPRVHCEWLRYVAPQLGLNTRKLIIGEVLSCIVGDDANCFTWARVARYFDPQLAIRAKADLLERLDWESGIGEVPEHVSTLLRETKGRVGELDWSQPLQFDEAREAWYAAMRQVENIMKETPELNAAFEYHREALNNLSNYWSAFLASSRRRAI